MTRRSPAVPALLALLAAACARPAASEMATPAAAPATESSVAPAAPATGLDVLRMMHDRYDGRWYRTLSFTQKSTRYLPNDSTTVETWYEYAAVPGRLRIDIGPREEGNGVLFARDSTYVFRDGTLARAVHDQNELLIVAFDVYGQPPERTAEALEAKGYPMSPVHADVWQGRPVWVIGAPAGDLHSKQLWFDQERLVFVRLLEPFARDTTKTYEIRFDDYVPAGGGWVGKRVEMLLDGRRVFLEEYSDVRSDVPLDESLFDPARWADAQ